MKVIHVIPDVTAEAAGPSHSVPRLCRSLAEVGHDVELSCHGAPKEIPGVRLDVHGSWPIARRFAVAPGLARALGRKAREVDIVHNHSLWSMVNVASGWVVPGKRAKLVTSPHGTLSAWALRRSRHVKRIVKPLQWRALLRADLLHATSEFEVQQIRDAGFTAPIAFIPHGIDLPAMPGATRFRPYRTLLFLGRIHPTKGVDRLLAAWRALHDDYADWRLVVAGTGEPRYVRYVHQLVHELKLKRVELPGPLFGADKAAAYFEAELFVLPTHSENFGMAIAEALAHGCPVIVGKGAPWQGIERENCGWWISNEIDELAATLGCAMARPREALKEMGSRGRSWMAREFGWDTIGCRMADAYRWVMGDSARTGDIRR